MKKVTVLVWAGANEVPHVHFRLSPAAQQRAAPSPACGDFFFSRPIKQSGPRARYRPSRASVARPSRPPAAPPRTQAATWAWAGKLYSRLGRKWPSAILANLGRWIRSDSRPSISRVQNLQASCSRKP